MAMIYYGWGDVLRNKQFIGYKYCECCNDFQPYYLSKLVFRVHISYIPIFWKNKGYYMTCNSCKLGQSLSRQEFRDLKAEYRQMTKSQAKKCFKDICRMCDAIGECTEANINYVMEQLAVTYPITANETLREHYREAVAMRLEMNEKAKHSQARIQGQQISPALPQTGAWICSCGTTNTTNFCSDCGAKRPESSSHSEEAPATDTISLPESMKEVRSVSVTVCPRCGKEDLNAPFFCSVCGSPMNAKN